MYYVNRKNFEQDTVIRESLKNQHTSTEIALCTSIFGETIPSKAADKELINVSQVVKDESLFTNAIEERLLNLCKKDNPYINELKKKKLEIESGDDIYTSIKEVDSSIEFIETIANELNWTKHDSLSKDSSQEKIKKTIIALAEKVFKS